MPAWMLMRYRLTLLLTAVLYGAGNLGSGAVAEVLLTRAVVKSLRNQVRLLPQNQSPRPARLADALAPGDALATAAASLAELRFNDGSLARVGEQAVFRFVARTRTFQLSNGTVLLLIPPGRGGTRVRTPNATAAIRGSALFVRYNAQTDTTILGALTNNPAGPMVLLNQDETQQQELAAGQLAVVVKGRIERVYKFDLQEFYRTSDLVQGLNLDQMPPGNEVDEAIAQVRSETIEALQTQSPLVRQSIIENPAFLQLSSTAPLPSSLLQTGNNPTLTGLDSTRATNRLDVPSLLTVGELQINTSSAFSNPPLNLPGGSSIGVGPGSSGLGIGVSGRSVGRNGLNIPGGGGIIVAPSSGITGGVFPGGGATGGIFPGRGATGGVFPGRGQGVGGAGN